MRRVLLNEIKLENIPQEVLEEVQAEGVELQSHLFQEILLYRGRQIVGSIGGVWSSHEKSEVGLFYPRSYGSKTIQWDGEATYRPSVIYIKALIRDEGDARLLITKLQKLELVNKDFRVKIVDSRLFAELTIFVTETYKIHTILKDEEERYVALEGNDSRIADLKHSKRWRDERMF